MPFGHTDPAGIVYYPRFFEWFHDAMEATFDAVCDRPYATLLSEEDVGYPAVQVACEYLAPVRFGEIVEIEVFLSRLSRRSATFEYRVRSGTGELRATASIKIATMRISEHRSAEMPKSVADAFAPYVETDDTEAPDTSRIR